MTLPPAPSVLSWLSALPAASGEEVPVRAEPILVSPVPGQTGVPEDITNTVPDPVEEGAQGAVDFLGPFWGILSTVLMGVAIALAVVLLGALVLNVVLRGRDELRRQVAQCRVPVAVALSLIAARVAVGLTAADYAWFNGLNFLLMAGIISSLAWLAVRIVKLVEERVLHRYQSAGEEDLRDRKIQTQAVLIRRILEVAILVVAISAILLTIPQVRAVGAGLLASAGLLSVVVGLAVQSTLTNVFAGIQLAFTDSIRVGDVVTVDQVNGVVEDITLAVVVVKIWDGRRMIYPSSHFTTTPFENWTRTGSALAGTVEMEVDWRVPMEPARARLRALLESTDLWDGKEGSMQVTDALGGMVTIRAVVSARNAGELWDLRCLVREDLVTFLRSEHPDAIYAQRMAGHVAVLSPAYGEDSEHTSDAGGSVDGGASGTLDDGQGGTRDGGAAGGRDGRRPRVSTDPLPRLDTGPQRHPVPGSLPRVSGTGSKAGADPQPVTGSPSGTGQQPDVGQRPAVTSAQPVVTGSTPLTRADEDSSMYTGSVTAIERNREVSGPGEKAFQERKEKAARADGDAEDERRHQDGKRH